MTNQLAVDRAALEGHLARYLAETYPDDWQLRLLSQHFRREGYVKLRDLFPREVFDQVRSEVLDLVDSRGRRIDIELKETGGTRRAMTTVGAAAIAEELDLVTELYRSPALKAFLSRLALEPVVECPWEDERFVAIRQDQPADTHGWHWGDFAFTVIWILEAPGSDLGGQLQTIPHTDWDKNDPRLTDHLEQYQIRTWAHAAGDLYFLRSDTTLHRTIPLRAAGRRTILNTCWASEQDLRKEKSHETMNAMFD